MIAGVSTNGVKLLYGIETEAGVKPATFTQLHRISNIGGIDLQPEQIDASALEDLASSYIAGRSDTNGTWAVEVNLTNETITEWTTLISASKSARNNNLNTWFEVVVEGLDEAFFVIAETPSQIPMPDVSQNVALVGTMNLTVNTYKGLDTKVVPA